MRYTDALELSATDLSNHLGCAHLTALGVATATGRLEPPVRRKDSALEALRQRGYDHERAYVEHLRRQGLVVVALPEQDLTASAVERTLAALREGPDIVVQAALAAGRWGGRADVLRRVDAPSALGPWSYEAVDTKLSRQTRGATILQLCLYSDLLGQAQARLPERMHVVTPGTGYVPEQYRLLDYYAFYRRTRRILEASVADIEAPPVTYPAPCTRCDFCIWRVACERRRRDDDHLCLVAGITKLQTGELQSRGVATLAALGELPSPLPFKPQRGSSAGFGRVRDQARIQLEGRRQRRPVHELLPREDERGLARLPEPSSGDVFFDFEGDPFVGELGREYLFGYLTIDGDAEHYTPLWALTPAAEREAFRSFIDRMIARWERFPGFHVYHYAPYEPAALKRLMGRYATREDELDRLLRAERFVDLHAVVKQSLRASVEKYSLKDLERFYGFTRAIDLHEANLQRYALQHALEMDEANSITDTMRTAVEVYNRDDCVSTRRLRDWLEGLRAQEIVGGADIPRPVLRTGDPSEQLTEAQQRVRALMARLQDGVAAVREERSVEQHARWLLAQTLEWHRREAKAVWWEYYRLRDLTDEEMLDEREAIAGLDLVERIGREKRSIVDRYRFPPQETSIRAEDTLKTSVVEKGHYGTVVALDAVARTIDIKKGPKTAALHARTVFVHDAVRTEVHEASLLRLGAWVADHGVDAPGPYRAARDLLLGGSPRLRSGLRGPLQTATETTLEAARRLIHDLDHGVLAVQGPPGCGKTYTGARMICELVRAGKKVGVTAVSHKVIQNLLQEVIRAAAAAGLSLHCVQKVSDPSPVPLAGIAEVERNEAIKEALDQGIAAVAGGTAWLWAREEMIAAVDVLFVDEAGQLSLANALAVAPCARSLVLLGDPQQLEQPQQGSHPEGTDVSALEHVLAGHKTMPPERGLFLNETWRLPPSVCAYTSELFYESRLRSREGLVRQRLDGDGPFAGAGLWFAPIEHEGNTNCAPEEVAQVARVVASLTSGSYGWIDADGHRHPLALGDILIVAPYNAQVAELTTRLPGARIGTVDKFQGQEAPVVIYSMTTSSSEEAPRGMEFLYSLHRLNVATSRAKCACILVASPRLLAAECQTPRRMKLANALCRYVELAREFSVARHS